MKQVCLNSNLVLIFDRNIYDDFAITDIENQIKEELGSDVKTGSTNIPNQVKAVFSTTNDIQIVGQGKSLIIVSSKINESNIVDEDFMRIAFSMKEFFKKRPLKIKFYGYNHTFSYLEDEFDKIKDKVKEKYLEKVKIPNGYTPSFELPVLSLIKNECRYTIAYGVEYSEEDNQPSKVSAVANYTPVNDKKIGENLNDFKSDYSKVYKEIYKLLDLSV